MDELSSMSDASDCLCFRRRRAVVTLRLILGVQSMFPKLERTLEMVIICIICCLGGDNSPTYLNQAMMPRNCLSICEL